MKRKALLIANTNGLQGTKKDLIKFSSFLKSDLGGVWLDTEIEQLYDPSLLALYVKLNTLKKEANDYTIVFFSGHGGQLRETVLEINGNGEQINESELKGLSNRQLTIFDCCRAYPQLIQDSISSEAYFSSVRKSVNYNLRELYNKRIMQAIPQQACLYSCSIGESSYDTADGAVYFGNFLKSARNITSTYKLVGNAHIEAIPPTVEYSRKQKDGLQNPDSSLPKCLSDQQLIISINQ